MRVKTTRDTDVATNLKKLMARDGLTFKEAVNQTLSRGLRQLDAADKVKSKKIRK